MQNIARERDRCLAGIEIFKHKVTLYEHMVTRLNHEHGFILPNEKRLVQKAIDETDFSQINQNQFADEQRQAAYALSNLQVGNDPYLTYEVVMINNVSNRKFELGNDRSTILNKMIKKVSNRIQQVNRTDPSPRSQAGTGLKNITSQDNLAFLSS